MPPAHQSWRAQHLNRRILLATSIIVFAVTTAGGVAGATTTPPSEPVGSDAEALTAAATETLDETAMSFDFTFTIEAASGEDTGRLAGAAEFPGRGEVVATSGDVETRVLFDGDDFWLTSEDPAITAALPSGVGWVHGSFAEVGDNGFVSRPGTPALLYLLNGAGNVTAEDVSEGAAYTFDVDLGAAIESAPEDRRPEVEALISSTGQPPEVTGEALVDDEGHVTEMSVTGVIPVDAGESAEITWSATFDNFGEPVTFEQPSDDTVVDLNDVPELRDLLLG